MKYSFARKTTRTDKNNNESIYITNCGYYHNIDYDINISRQQGRNDYHLLLPISGQITINDDMITPQYAYIYFPNEPQIYVYKKTEESEYYWLHFDGNNVIKIIEELSLHSGKYYIGKNYSKIASLIKLAFNEISTQYSQMDKFTNGICLSILTILSTPPQSDTPFYRGIKLLSDPNCHMEISEIADMYKISVPHFIRSFKNTTGLSPLAYRTEKMLQLACQLLTETSLSIEKISLSVGYNDQLYFSRLFKKKFNISPSEYRKQNVI